MNNNFSLYEQQILAQQRAALMAGGYGAYNPQMQQSMMHPQQQQHDMGNSPGSASAYPLPPQNNNNNNNNLMMDPQMMQMMQHQQQRMLQQQHQMHPMHQQQAENNSINFAPTPVTTLLTTAATNLAPAVPPPNKSRPIELSGPIDDSDRPPAKKRKTKSDSELPSKKTNTRDTKWLQSYNDLLQYKKEHGDCIVPRGYVFNPRLAVWVAEQRKQHKLRMDGRSSSISQQRIALLEEVDFAWNAQEAAWEKHMRDLKQFKEEYGDCLVPVNHPNFPKLGLWVKEQRRHYNFLKRGKPSHMTDARFEELNALGFCWDTQEAVWGERLRELKLFKSCNGHSMVPTHYAANARLGTWVHHQRRQYREYKRGRSCHITQERIAALDKIGFIWHPRDKSGKNIEVSDDSDPEDEDVDLPNEFDLRPKKRVREGRTQSA